jgi:NOL1/NOP2/fmu family ribosome biogenesis protein
MGCVMLRYNILNSKETKHILEKINNQYGYNIDKHDLDYAFLMNKDERIYIVSKDLGNIPYDDMKIDGVGIYFGEVYKDKLRLSIEGAQIIGPHATKNIYDLNYDQMISWIKGNEIEFEDVGEELVIVRYLEPKTQKYDILGCGKYNRQTGKLLNYVSKSRKLVVVND